MRKLFALLLILTILPLPVLAEADLSAMSVDELRKLRDNINLELAARAQTPDSVATWSTPLARIDLVSVTRGTNKDGAACVELVLSYTNMGESIDHFRNAHWINLYQCGVEQDTSVFFNDKLVDVDSWSSKVQPGATLSMQWVFLVPEDSTTIDIEVEYRHDFKTDSAGLVTVTLPD